MVTKRPFFEKNGLSSVLIKDNSSLLQILRLDGAAAIRLCPLHRGIQNAIYFAIECFQRFGCGHATFALDVRTDFAGDDQRFTFRSLCCAAFFFAIF